MASSPPFSAPHVRVIDAPRTFAKKFSFVTLVASWERYERMVRSFEARGFDAARAEFFALDNTQGNKFDGFDALRDVYPRCAGEFIVFAHDDIELIEQGADDLERILADLAREDPLWMVAGNSGTRPGVWRWEDYDRHIVDPLGDRSIGDAPRRAFSLDENFMILRAAKIALPSIDLDGFHQYGADICLHARLLGGRIYVIPFLLRHHSGGNPWSDSYWDSIRRFERKYTALILPQQIATPSSRLFIGPARETRRVAFKQYQAVARLAGKGARGLKKVFGGGEPRDTQKGSARRKGAADREGDEA